MKLVVDPFRRNPLPKARRMNQLKAGVAGVRAPVCYQGPGLPDRGVRRSRCEGSQNLRQAPKVLRVLSSATNALKAALKGPGR